MLLLASAERAYSGINRSNREYSKGLLTVTARATSERFTSTLRGNPHELWRAWSDGYPPRYTRSRGRGPSQQGNRTRSPVQSAADCQAAGGRCIRLQRPPSPYAEPPTSAAKRNA